MNLDDVLDRVFGNNDGDWNLKDIPHAGPKIAAVVVDLVVLVAEYRVFMIGYTLTADPLLALGFVAVSSIPFFLGQILFLYPRRNAIQTGISVFMIALGLGVGAYFGLAEYVTATAINIGEVAIQFDTAMIYIVAIVATVALIVSGLLYLLVDDGIQARIKATQLKEKAGQELENMAQYNEVLDAFEKTAQREQELRQRYGNTAVDKLLNGNKPRPANPTNGNRQ